MTGKPRKPPFLKGYDPAKAIGRFTEGGIELKDGMSPENFRALAYAIAGPHWKGDLGDKIGRSRSQVWEYATGKRPVPKPVALLMGQLVKCIGEEGQ